MKFNLEAIMPYFIFIGIFILSVILGVIFKKVVHSRLLRLSEKTSWKGDDIILRAVGKSVLLWFILGGFYLAIDYLSISAELEHGFRIFIFVIFILSLTIAISKITVELLKLYSEKTGGAFPSTTMFNNLIRIVIITIGLLMIFQTLGISITPALTALGVGGLAISLALKDTLSDVFAGLHILISKKMKPGDMISLESGEKGTVENISWRNTGIRDRLNNLIIIPNSKLSTAMVTNYNYPVQEVAMRVRCGVSYDSDLEHVEKVTIEVAQEVLKEVDGGITDSEPSLVFLNFGESSIDFRVKLLAKDFDGGLMVQHEFIKRLKKRYDEEGINIPFPIRTIYKGSE